jgi:hypothetical protein
MVRDAQTGMICMPVSAAETATWRPLAHAEQELLALGATRVPGERETGFRVFTDPVGQPFCIVFGPHSTD